VDNPFTKHPRECVGETWWRHCQFAIGVGVRLVFTAIIFVIHAVFPFVGIPRWLNLEDTIVFLERENENREDKKVEHSFPPNDFPLTPEDLEKWKKNK